MYIKIILLIVYISCVYCDPRRVPKIYNAVITSEDNLQPSKAFPIIQPVIQPAAIAYQVHLPYIPNGAFANYIQPQVYPNIYIYSNNEQSENFQQSHQRNYGTIQNLDSSSAKVPRKFEPVPNLESAQTQAQTQANIVQAKAILSPRTNIPREQIPNHQIPQQSFISSQNSGSSYSQESLNDPHQIQPDVYSQQPHGIAPQEVQNVAPGHVKPQSIGTAPQIQNTASFQNVNEPSSAGGMPQHGDILNNHFRQKYPDIPDVPPPPLPTTRRKDEQPSNVQPNQLFN